MSAAIVDRHYAVRCTYLYLTDVTYPAGMSESSVAEALRQNFGAECGHEQCPPGSHVVLLVTTTREERTVTRGALLNLRKAR